LLSAISYRLQNFASLPRLPASCAAIRGFLRRENPTYTYWRRAARGNRGFKMVLFTEPSTFVGGKCALPSALLVVQFSSLILGMGHSRTFCRFALSLELGTHTHVSAVIILMITLAAGSCVLCATDNKHYRAYTSSGHTRRQFLYETVAYCIISGNNG